METLGYLNMIGDGPLFITEDGFSVIFTVGHGFQATIGVLLGSIGDQVEAIMVGCHLDLKPISTALLAIMITPIGFLSQGAGY